MATRLQKALAELNAAMGGRPYVLVFDHTHAEAPVSGVSVVTPVRQPGYISKGLLAEGPPAVDRLLEGSRTSSSHTVQGGRQEPMDRREREKRTLDLLGLVLDLSPFSGEELYNVVLAWTDAELEDVGEWAGKVYLKASDNDDIEVPPKPVCIPPEWSNP